MEVSYMKGIKWILMGICLCLFAIAFSSYNIISIAISFIGLIAAAVGLFINE